MASYYCCCYGYFSYHAILRHSESFFIESRESQDPAQEFVSLCSSSARWQQTTGTSEGLCLACGRSVVLPLESFKNAMNLSFKISDSKERNHGDKVVRVWISVWRNLWLPDISTFILKHYFTLSLQWRLETSHWLTCTKPSPAEWRQPVVVVGLLPNPLNPKLQSNSTVRSWGRGLKEVRGTYTWQIPCCISSSPPPLIWRDLEILSISRGTQWVGQEEDELRKCRWGDALCWRALGEEGSEAGF